MRQTTRSEQSGQVACNAVAEKRIDLAYDAASQWQTITRYADLVGTKLVAQSDYNLDAAGRLTALAHAQGATTLADYNWTYDAVHRVTSFTSLADGTADYSYDQTHQLLGADYTAGAGLPPAPPDEAFAYDANGNRIMSGYVTGQNNQVLSDGVYDYQYDSEGNRTRRTHIASGEATDYHGDHRNRLVKVIHRDAGGQPTKTVEYDYDGLNRRITTHLDSGAPSNPTGIDTYIHDYYNSSWQILETRQSDTESAPPETLQPKHQYVWSQRYIDAPVLRDENTAANGLCDDERLYFLNDANFNVTALLDTAGDALERYVYSPYGVVTFRRCLTSRFDCLKCSTIASELNVKAGKLHARSTA